MRDKEIVGLYEAYNSIYQTNESDEFEGWVNSLVEEGYDLSDYTWDEMYEMYVNLDENMSPAELERIASQAVSETSSKKKKKPKTQRPIRAGMQESMTPADIERIAQQAAGTEKKKKKKLSAGMKESYDTYDLILSHLLDEGYAETEEAAKVIMVNMSEEWRESILSDLQELVVGGQSPRQPTPQQSQKSKPKVPPKNPLPRGPQPGGYGVGFGG